MSVELMLHATIESVKTLSIKVGELTQATIELCEVTKALHRERAAQIRQEVDELDPDPKVSNVKTWHLHERLRALEMPPRGNGEG